MGLPVDPGNLLLFAKIGSMRVLGIPGSARSPRLHGFDWVLQRLVAGLDVTPEDLTRMGVGGMLKEMPGRPLSREQEELDEMPDQVSPTIGGVLLAAGQSRRMGRTNKMLVEVDGAPMVLHAARAMLASSVSPVVVVLGHQPEQVERALRGIDVRFVRNPDYAEGLSTSLKSGLTALPDTCDGAVGHWEICRASALTTSTALSANSPPTAVNRLSSRRMTAKGATPSSGRDGISMKSQRFLGMWVPDT